MAVRYSTFKLRKKNKFDLEGADDLEHNLAMLERETRKRIVVDGLYEGSRVTAARVRMLMPKGDTGALLRSLDHKRLKSSVRIRVGSKEAFYAPWLEYGTSPHVIKPRNRKALSIGGSAYASANHPGIRPHPFLRRSMDETRRRVVDIAARSIRSDIDRLPFRGT